MMTPEEFERLKQEEKEHLRAIKQLKATARRLRMKRSVQEALSAMLEGRRQAFDIHDEMIQRLAFETARHEARYEIASEESRSGDEVPKEETLRDFEKEQVEERARELVRRMKKSLAASPEKPSPAPTPDRPSDDDAPEQRPDKTIGRM